jgi:AraC family transcriptional regulator, transcriptional activator of pobA
MSDLLLPLHQFNLQRSHDLPFEIGHLEEMPALAQAPFPHRHTFYEIFLITAGSGQHHIDFTAYPIDANTLYFITPGQVHYWELEQPLQGYVMLFTEEFLLLHRLERDFLRRFDFFHRIDHPPLLRVSAQDAVLFGAVCRQLREEYQTMAFGRAMLLQSLLQVLLIHVQRRYHVLYNQVEPSAGENLSQQFIRLIDQHFHQKKP